MAWNRIIDDTIITVSMMIKIISLVLAVCIIEIYGQRELVYYGNDCDHFLEFSSLNNELILISREIYCTEEIDSCVSNFFLNFCSVESGQLNKQIELTPRNYFVQNFALNNASNKCVLQMSEWVQYPPKYDSNILKCYSLISEKWLWETKLDSKVICLRMTFNEDDKQIICVTTKEVIIFDAETGSLIKKSNSISSVIDPDTKYARFDLSKNGKYFAYWKAKFLTFSKDDESMMLTLFDLLWYGTKWLANFGEIPQNVYIWDICEDKLYDEIPIPFESNKGTPVFNGFENELLIGPLKSKYMVYSVNDKKVLRDFIQKESIYTGAVSERSEINSIDYKIISPDQKFIAACFGLGKIFIIDYENGTLVKKFEQTGSKTFGEKYAMAFSPDSKFFAVVTAGNKICLYSTQTWEKIWEINYDKHAKIN